MGKLDDIIQKEIEYDERYTLLSENNYIDFPNFLEIMTAFVESNRHDTARFLTNNNFLSLDFYTNDMCFNIFDYIFVKHNFDEYKNIEIIDEEFELNLPIENFLQKYTDNKYANSFFELYYFKLSDLLNNTTINKTSITLNDINKYMEALENHTLQNTVNILNRPMPQNQTQVKNNKLKARVAELEQQLLEAQQVTFTSGVDCEMTDTNKHNHLVTIGLLIELLTTPKNQDPSTKPTYPSNAKIIEKILYKEISGQKLSTLENRFSDAKKALEQAEKK